MEIVDKKKVLKTKQGNPRDKLTPRSKIFTVENEKTDRKIVIEQISAEDIEAVRNPAYQYLA